MYGQKFEQVVSNIYSQLNQIDVIEFGLLVHPEHKFLGASPDGIIFFLKKDCKKKHE